MKYILTRIIILTLVVITLNYISNFVSENAEPEYGYMEGAITLFRLLFALGIISLCIFSYEAYRFNKQSKIRERNSSLTLISTILLLVVIFGRYFLEFAF